MLLCPKCNKKYEEGFTVCAICGSDLIDYQPLVEEEVLEQTAHERGEDQVEYAFEPEEAQLSEEQAPALLITVNDAIEAERILNLMEDYAIPSFKKTDSAGGVAEILTGNRYHAYDIYVPGALLPRAMQALEDQGLLTESDEQPSSEQPVEEVAEPEQDLESEVDDEVEQPSTQKEATQVRRGRAGIPIAIGAILILLVILLLYLFGRG